MTTQLNQLTELTTTSDDDLILIREDSTGIDKKMKAQNIRAKATTKDDVGLGNVTNDAQFKLADAGTAATADVTTSFTDTTAGRLLKVGDFGVGTMPFISSSAFDIDDITTPSGSYFISSPSDSSGVWPGGFQGVANANAVVLIENRGDAIVFQRLISVRERVGVNLGEQWTRVYNSGWQPWRELYHTANVLGTVSQSAGVPTGAVIERGSNANGEFVRFADGTQICTRFIQVAFEDAPVVYTDSNTGLVSIRLANDLSFPSPFAGGNADYVGSALVASGGGTSTARQFAWANSINQNDGSPNKNRWARPSAVVVGTPLDPDVISMDLIAIGRWFD